MPEHDPDCAVTRFGRREPCTCSVHRGKIPCPVCGADPATPHTPAAAVNRPTLTPEPNRHDTEA